MTHDVVLLVCTNMMLAWIPFMGLMLGAYIIQRLIWD